MKISGEFLSEESFLGEMSQGIFLGGGTFRGLVQKKLSRKLFFLQGNFRGLSGHYVQITMNYAEL